MAYDTTADAATRVAKDAFRTFAIESPHQIRTLRKRLQERKASLSDAVVGGFALDWADYKSRIGELRGIEHALGICDELEKQESE